MATVFLYAIIADRFPLDPSAFYSTSFIGQATGFGTLTITGAVPSTTSFSFVTKQFRYWAKNIITDPNSSYSSVIWPFSPYVTLRGAQGRNIGQFQVTTQSPNSDLGTVVAVYGRAPFEPVQPFGGPLKTAFTKPTYKGYLLQPRLNLIFNSAHVCVMPRTGALEEFIFSARHTGNTTSQIQLYLTRGGVAYPLLREFIDVPPNCEFYQKRCSFLPGIGVYQGETVFAVADTLDPNMVDARTEVNLVGYTADEPNG